jgi:CheY-like chemotaxis protein
MIEGLAEDGRQASPGAMWTRTADRVTNGDRYAMNALRLLLVEDHADTAKAMARLLKVSGHVVTVAESAQAALQHASSNEFDLVISDIGLPDATGYELMTLLRDTHGLKGIALTGYGTDEDLQKAKDSGFIDHVLKPINLATLNAAIEKARQGPG